MSDVDISSSSRPASRSSSLDTCGLDQQQTAQAKSAAQVATMVTLWNASSVPDPVIPHRRPFLPLGMPMILKQALLRGARMKNLRTM